MSDSDDDNAYSDYLASRRAVLQKKRHVAVVVEDDVDDEFDAVFRTRPPTQKRTKRKRDVVTLDDDDDDDDEADTSKAEPVTTHQEHLKTKSQEMEEVFRRDLYRNDMILINRNFSSDNVKSTLEMCKTCDLKEDSVTETSPGTEIDEANLSFQPITRVEIDVLDCEMTRNGKKTHMMSSDSTFLEVRKRIAATWQCDVDDVILMLKGAPISAETTPESLGIVPMKLPLTVFEAHRKDRFGEELEVVTVNDDDDDGDDEDVGDITLKVQMKNRKKPVFVGVKPEMPLLTVKRMIRDAFIEEEEENGGRVPPVSRMKVMFDDEYLTDDTATVDAIGFEDGDCLDIYT